MRVEEFVDILGADFFTGVPDSCLKPLGNYLMDTYGIDPEHHIIGVNEGNCAALGAGYYLATGKIPVVYMQNSGEGNVINPLASLLSPEVYAIPTIFVIGWRGEPGVHDEPQHVYQGKVTLTLLEDMGVDAFVISNETTVEQLDSAFSQFKKGLDEGKSCAFVVKKGALSFDKKVEYSNEYELSREEIIHHITGYSKNDPVISTTGKASRELFEIREGEKDIHGRDFLTVGSMGHASSIALSVALKKPQTRIWCIDGDGAALMHMGAMALIGSLKPDNMIHVVINNNSHETVGGMPTVAGEVSLVDIAKGCGYPYAVCVDTFEALDRELEKVSQKRGLALIEVKSSIGCRADLGRPTIPALQNRINFMEYLKKQV